MTDIKHLVMLATQCDWEVDLLLGRYVVDAKSMLGVLSLPQFEQAELFLHCEKENVEAAHFYEKLEEYGLYRKQ